MSTLIDHKTTVFDKFPTIRTPHLELVQITEKHAHDLFKILCDKQVSQYYNLLPPEDENDCQRLIDYFRERFKSKSAIRWGIQQNDNNEIIGTVGFNHFTKKHRANIGYDLQYSYCNKDVIAEALYAVISFGFFALDINRIEVEVMEGNDLSIELLNRIGFKQEGTLRQWHYWDDKHYDMLMFSLLRSDGEA
ncbi:GNAT family N-acetyltransferase [Chitinophaga ginsengisoli]|uniref:Ribosomal-protein-alanine N-acetyltransferase n=1 Tax=Chitinophaga ginsengisoli TaxID=363837 RepID=A0A2P8GKR9_9BACT|nr:GNAT family protein [Chitinophaga ginsengisoli]PSL34563.1 ribosomal-protein-alanine N-acetyltransferase [Chitinophaga ginsengisoli]